jgi:hypothetical protein
MTAGAPILTASSIAFPTAPQMLPWSQLPGVSPQQWRMLQFGTYLFPVTFQERNRDQKLALVKKKLPFNPGDFVPGNSSVSGRTLEFYGSVSTGMIGFGGKLIKTQTDLEAERQYLAGLQDLGRQSLYVGADRFIWAYLEDFSYSFQDSGGFRVADWSAKFYCDDPRYYGASSWQENSGTSSQGGLPNMNTIIYQASGLAAGPAGNPHAIVQDGNTKAFPIFVLTVTAGSYQSPQFIMSTYPVTAGAPNSAYRQQGMGMTFSKFNNAAPMGVGDQLVVICDPRPEYSLISATYYQGGGWPTGGSPVNALAYVVPGNGDLINNVDWQYFLPWISSSTVDDGSGGMNTFLFTATVTAGSAHTTQVMYYDTYL